MATSNPNPNGPVEKKVTTASAAALITAFIMTMLMKAIPVLAPLNDVVEALISAAVVAVITWVVAYWTKHTSRNDAATRRTGTSDPIQPTG